MRGIAGFFAGFLVLASVPAYAGQQRTSTQLIMQAAALDNERVLFEGEVIGDIMARSGGAWVNVYDGANGIGCWVPAAEAGKIGLTGGYKATGDRVEVSGIFHRACLAHGGDLDIHATEIRVISSGATTPHPVSSRKKEASLMLLGVACLALILKVLK